MSIDLKSIAKNAIKKHTGQKYAVEVMELFPWKEKEQKNSLEEGTIKLNFPELGIEITSVVYKVRPGKNISILMPYKAYPRDDGTKNKKNKPRNHTVYLLKFKDEEVWLQVREEIKKQVREKYDNKQKKLSSQPTP